MIILIILGNFGKIGSETPIFLVRIPASFREVIHHKAFYLKKQLKQASPKRLNMGLEAREDKLLQHDQLDYYSILGM